MLLETSCGGIVFRKDKYLVIKQSHGHWGFPKGHVQEGETEEQTALREIREETGLNVEIIEGFSESLFYIDHVNHVRKAAVYFLCRAKSSEVKLLADDVVDYAWLRYGDALEKLTHGDTKQLLKKAELFLKK